MGQALVVKEVSKQLGGRDVLQDVSFSVEEGEIFGLIGMSGSGKTTILHHLVGFLEPDKGEILYADNKTLRSLSQHVLLARQMFGFAPQTPSIYPHLTLDENLVYFGTLYQLEHKEILASSEKILGLMRLKEHRTKLAKELSGGMQRRLSLACSIIHNPKVLILDEPTSDLDPVLRDEMWTLIKDINKQGTTIIVASHFLEELERACSKVAILHDGKILKSGALQELRKGSSARITVVTSQPKPVITYVGKDSVVSSDDTQVTFESKKPFLLLRKLMSGMQSEKIKADSLDVHTASLKEVFVEATKP